MLYYATFSFCLTALRYFSRVNPQSARSQGKPWWTAAVIFYRLNAIQLPDIGWVTISRHVNQLNMLPTSDPGELSLVIHRVGAGGGVLKQTDSSSAAFMK